MTSPVIEKAYLPSSEGQIHCRSIASVGGPQHAPLICLHPAPYSGAYFTTVMPMVNRGRRVIAPDYPGYGGSYPLDEPPSIMDYANAMLHAVLGAESSAQVDLLGFHSGCLVAAEMSLLAAGRVRHLLLIDVPCFDSDTQQTLYAQVAKPLPLTRDIECLAKAWDFNVAGRKDVVPLDRALALFVDQLGAGRRDHFCFHAAFTYDCIERLARVHVPTTVVATRSPLLEPTLAAARLIPHASLIEVDEITTSVFEQGASIIAGTIVDVLDRA